MLSGMVRINLYPLAAVISANPIPVFPLVGSIITESLFNIFFSSASSIIARETLSLMLPEGLNDSSLANMLALILSFLVILFTSTRGVFPITFNIFLFIINNYSQTYNTYRYSIQPYYDFKI